MPTALLPSLPLPPSRSIYTSESTCRMKQIDDTSHLCVAQGIRHRHTISVSFVFSINTTPPEPTHTYIHPGVRDRDAAMHRCFLSRTAPGSLRSVLISAPRVIKATPPPRRTKNEGIIVVTDEAHLLYLYQFSRGCPKCVSSLGPTAAAVSRAPTSSTKYLFC